jgi:cytochrome c biogenesis protein CcmG/thiol:disulfide interchange protein DsbE
MKQVLFSLLLVISSSIFAQSSNPVPSVNLKDLNGKQVNIKDLVGNDKPTVISFWATWCSPCKRELNNIAELYEDWQEETGVNIIAVSIDDARSSLRVKPYVNGKAWDYEVLLDANQDLKRAMNVNTIPHTFLVDGDGNIVWQHTSYAEGDEDELYHKIVEIAK